MEQVPLSHGLSGDSHVLGVRKDLIRILVMQLSRVARRPLSESQMRSNSKYELYTRRSRGQNTEESHRARLVGALPCACEHAVSLCASLPASGMLSTKIRNDVK